MDISGAVAEEVMPDFVRSGTAGFVISHIQYALAGEASETGACPDGMNSSYADPRDAYINFPEFDHQAPATFEELEDEVRDIALADQSIKSQCLYPDQATVEHPFKVVENDKVRVEGIDLDGRHSRMTSQHEADHCPHQDFKGVRGKAGIDNQLYRVLGCTNGYQPSGLGNDFNIAQLAGAWGIVLRISDIDSIENDSYVEIEIAANRDPIRLGPQRDPLSYATYTLHPDPRFRAKTQGKVVDGTLYSEPVEIRIPHDINAMYVERVLYDAQLQLSLSNNGELNGYLAGFAPIEDQYDLDFGFRDARETTDPESPLGPYRTRLISGIGKAGALGYTCAGVYHALYEYADGHKNAATGKCESISTQYLIRAIPAFVVE